MEGVVKGFDSLEGAFGEAGQDQIFRSAEIILGLAREKAGIRRFSEE
jgi:hypothetical protein